MSTLTRLQTPKEKVSEVSDVVEFGSISNDFAFWFAIVAATAVVGAQISRSSLWIDEGFTAWIVVHSSLSSFLAALTGPFASPDDRQYPLYLLWVWFWCKAFGYSELSLRAANLPFAGLFVFAIAVTSRIVSGRRFSWLPFAFAPYFLYYVSEARAYLMLMSLSTAAVGAIIVYCYGPVRYRRAAIWTFLVSALLAMMCQILVLFLFFGLAIFVAASYRDWIRLPVLQNWRRPVLIISPCFLMVIGYYGCTLIGSAGREELEDHQRSFPALAYGAEVLYEQFGLAGLGPPRTLLRAASFAGGLPYLPWLIIGTGLIAAAIVYSLRISPDRRVMSLVAGWVGAITLGIAISFATQTGVLGRYLSAAFPFGLFAGVLLMRERFPLLLIAIAFVMSDVRSTCIAEYAKDNYRSAVADLISRNSEVPGHVDWAADEHTADYYGLKLLFPGDATLERDEQVDFVRRLDGTYSGNLKPQAAEAMLRKQLSTGEPVYLALSRADLYDRYGGWRTAISRHGARPIEELAGFQLFVFEKR